MNEWIGSSARTRKSPLPVGPAAKVPPRMETRSSMPIRPRPPPTSIDLASIMTGLTTSIWMEASVGRTATETRAGLAYLAALVSGSLVSPALRSGVE